MLFGLDCFGFSGLISELRLSVYLQCIRICRWDEQWEPRSNEIASLRTVVGKTSLLSDSLTLMILWTQIFL